MECFNFIGLFMIKKWLVCLTFPFVLFASIPTPLSNPDLMAYVDKNLPHEGILKQTQEGFLYIELPKDYVFALQRFLPKTCPPPYFKKGKIGAHITVVTAREMKDLNFPKVPFLGEKISFSIQSLEKVSLENSEIGSEAYLLLIDSPKILEIRKKLSLPLKIKAVDFHITIGVNCP